MKSAYELAMERLNSAGSDIRSINDDQKERLAEIDRTALARIAEIKVMEEPKVNAIRAYGKAPEAALIEEEMRRKIESIKAEAEKSKEDVRKEGP